MLEPVTIRASDDDLTTDQSFVIHVRAREQAYEPSRLLRRIDVYRASGYATGAADEIVVDGDNDLLPYLESYPEIREDRTQPDRLTLNVIGASAWNAARLIAGRSRIVLRYSDGSHTSWRATRIRRPADGSGSMQITAEPLWLDLATTIFRYYRVGNTARARALRNITLQRALEIALSAENGRPSNVRLGIVDPAIANTLVNLEANLSTHLELLRDLVDQAEAEYEAHEEAGIIYLDFVRQAGWSADEYAAGQPLPSSRPVDSPSRLSDVSNRRTQSEDVDASGYFSRVIPVLGASDAPHTIRGMWWPVVDGGDGSYKLEADLPFWRDGVYVGYGLAFEDGTYARITASSADGSVTVSGSKTLAAGAYVKLVEIVDGPSTGTVADHTVVDLDYAHDPAMEAEAGVAELYHDLSDTAPYDNLFEQIGNASIGSDLQGWEATGGATVEAIQSELYTLHGTHSLRATGDAGQGVRTLTMSIPPEPRRVTPYVSAWLSIRALSGSCTMRIVDVTDDGRTVYPPANDRQINIAEGDDAGLAAAVAGMEMEGADFVVEVEFLEDGTEVIIDAVTATNSADAFEYVPDMGPRAMFVRALKLLDSQGGVRPNRLEGTTYDVTQYASGVDGAEIRAGSWVQVRDFYDAATGTYRLSEAARVETLSYIDDPRLGRIEKRITLAARRKTFLERLKPPVQRPKSPLVPGKAGRSITLPRPYFAVSSQIEGGGAVFRLHATADEITDRIHYEAWIAGTLVESGFVDFDPATTIATHSIIVEASDGELTTQQSYGLSIVSGEGASHSQTAHPVTLRASDGTLYSDQAFVLRVGTVATNADGSLTIVLNPQRPAYVGDSVKIVAWGESVELGLVQDPKWQLEGRSLEEFILQLESRVDLKADLTYVDEWGQQVASAQAGLEAWTLAEINALDDDILALGAGLDLKADISYVDAGTGALHTALTALEFEVGQIGDVDFTELWSAIQLRATIEYVDDETGVITSAVSGLASRVTSTEGTIDDLDDELADLITEVAANYGLIVDLDGELNAVVSQLSAFATQEYVDDEMGDVLSAVAGLEALIISIGDEDITSILSALELKADITYVDQETGAVSGAVSGLESWAQAQFDSVDGSISNLSAGLDAKADISYVDDETGTIASAVSGLSGRVDTVEGTIDDLDDELADVIQDVAANYGLITDLDGELTGVISQLSTFATQEYVNDEMGDVLSAVAGLEALIISIGDEDIGDILAAVALKADLTYVNEQLGIVNTAIAGVETWAQGEISDLDGALDNLAAGLDAYAKITYVDDEVGTATDAIAGLSTRVGTVEDDVEDIQGDLPNLWAEFDLYASLSDLEDEDGPLAGLYGRVDSTESALGGTVRWEESEGSYTLRAGPGGSIFEIDADQIDLNGIVSHLEAEDLTLYGTFLSEGEVDGHAWMLSMEDGVLYARSQQAAGVTNTELSPDGLMLYPMNIPEGWSWFTSDGVALYSPGTSFLDPPASFFDMNGIRIGNDTQSVRSRLMRNALEFWSSTPGGLLAEITPYDMQLVGLPAYSDLVDDFDDHTLHRTDSQNDSRYVRIQAIPPSGGTNVPVTFMLPGGGAFTVTGNYNP